MSLVLLGILNSQAAGAGGLTDAYDHIATANLSSSTSAVFSSISPDYTHLILKIRARSSRSSTNDTGILKFNNSTSLAGTGRYFFADGSGGYLVSGTTSTTSGTFECGRNAAASAISNRIGYHYVILSHYATSGMRKGYYFEGWQPGQSPQYQGAWGINTTSAINQIEYYSQNGTTTGTVSLYGVL